MSETSPSGIGLLGSLGLLFVGLKLADYIDWSWWWVTAPFWGPFAVLFAVYCVCLIPTIAVLIFAIYKDVAKRQGKSKT